MILVRWLEPGIEDDLTLVPAVTDVVNRAYAAAEAALFSRSIHRTDAEEVAASIARGETAAAFLDGGLVGSVRARALDPATGWFGALGVDPDLQGRGFGAALVGFVEDDAVAAGRTEMQLEVFQPEPDTPHGTRLRTWYERRGYRETSRVALAEVFPEDAAVLAVAGCDIVTMRKPL